MTGAGALMPGAIARQRQCDSLQGGIQDYASATSGFRTQRPSGIHKVKIALFGEDLAHIGEGFELKRISRRIEEEHRRLLADLALEAHMRLDNE